MANDFLTKRVAKATYDFAVDGGAVSDILIGALIPKDAIITGFISEAVSNFTSGGAAEVAVANVAVKAAAAFDNVAYQGSDVHAVTADKTTSDGKIKLTVSAAPLTGGKMNIFIEYLF